MRRTQPQQGIVRPHLRAFSHLKILYLFHRRQSYKISCKRAQKKLALICRVPPKLFKFRANEHHQHSFFLILVKVFQKNDH